MSRHVLIIGCFLVFLGCENPNRYYISGIEQEVLSYEQLLVQANEKLADDPKNPDLIIRRLYANKELNWPEDVSADIQHLISSQGLDYQLYNYAIDFYLSEKNYKALNGVVDLWLSSQIPQSQDLQLKIKALRGLNKNQEIEDFLESFLLNSNRKEDLLFAANEYMALGDTLSSIRVYEQVARDYPEEPAFLNQYIPYLIDRGHDQEARRLIRYQKEALSDYATGERIARILFDMGDKKEAFSILKGYFLSESFFLQMEWYHQGNQLDSALYYANLLLEIDPSREVMLKKADIQEQRGLLYGALETFRNILNTFPNDSIATVRIQIVERKIAYLRRLREARQAVPVIDLTPKRSTENE